MRVLLQRVKEAQVTVENKVVGKISQGLLLFLGIHQNDNVEKIPYFVEKVTNLRVFGDEQGKMNLSVKDVEGSVLIISQFTLYGDTRTGRRPSFTQAMPPAEAEALYQTFIQKFQAVMGESQVATGSFGASMEVELTNDGPVTLLLSH